jgi:hypothetical protein
MKGVLVFIIVPCFHLAFVDGTFDPDGNEPEGDGRRSSSARANHDQRFLGIGLYGGKQMWQGQPEIRRD